MGQNNKFMTLALLLAMPVTGFAADAAAATTQTGERFNVLLVGLVSLVIILLGAIALLGNVLISLIGVYKEKLRSDKQKNNTARTALLLLLLMAPVSMLHAQEQVAAKAPSIIAGIPAFDFYLLIAIIALELLVAVTLLAIMALLVRALSARPETAQQAKAIVRKPFWDRFNQAVALEKEQDILLDHDYDGIKELDNSLPPWWKYGFYLTIVIAVLYMYYYHAGGNGPGSLEEYAMEVQKGEEDKAKYLALAANNVDETTVKMVDAAGIASGEKLYISLCAACHANDGGGGVGPNLTDDYWMHGGSLADVFKSIKYGWPDKGMKSWKDDFSPKQIAELSSYIKSLKGTKPAAPKDKQGELYTEGNTQQADTAGVATNN